MRSRRITLLALLGTALAATATAGENGAMTMANQLEPFDHDNNPATPPIQRVKFDANAGANDNVYLRFLRDHLLYQPANSAYQNPASYLPVTLIDDGFDNGGRDDRAEIGSQFPATGGGSARQFAFPEFFENGDASKDPRIVFSFYYPYQDSNGFGAGAWMAGNPATYPDFGHGFQATGDGYGGTHHGHQMASLLIGYNGRTGATYRDPATQLAYGMGVSPYGRISNAKFWDINDVGGSYTTKPQSDGYEPMDFYWIVDKSWDLTESIEGARPAVMLFNCSFGNEIFSYTDPQDPNFDPNFNPLDPNVNPTRTTYDGFAENFDLMTRSATNPAWHPDKPARPSLFVFGVGQLGYENYGNGWERYVDGGTPTETHWFEPDRPGIVYGFHIPRTNTVASPAIAKNVLAVGASDVRDVRPPANCPGAPDPLPTYIQENRAYTSTLGQSVENVASESPKGKLGDVRVRPDVVAPGNSDYANFPDIETDCIPGFENLFVNAMNNPFSYIRTRRTSPATAMVSGLTQLSIFHLDRAYGVTAPSPALLKAYVINTAQMLHGWHTGRLDPNYPLPPPGYAGLAPPVTPRYITHPLPSPYQGFGRVDTSVALDRTPRFFVNQETVLTEGGVYTAAGEVAQEGRRVRVTLCWTDPPNLANPKDSWLNLENNLDLEVRVTRPGEATELYLGNRFSTDQASLEYSQVIEPGTREPDRVNNVECVFLPPQPVGSRMEITVRANGLGMDGIDVYTQDTANPRQDFALVAYNMVEEIENNSEAIAIAIAPDSNGTTAGWHSSPQLARGGAGTHYYEVSPLPEGRVQLSATLQNEAPVFTHGDALVWASGSAPLVQDPTQGMVYQATARAVAGARLDESTSPWAIPAWDLDGKSIVSFLGRATLRAAQMGFHVEATDGQRYDLVYTSDTTSSSVTGKVATIRLGNAGFWGGWHAVSRDMAADLAQFFPGAVFARVTGLEVNPAAGGELRFKDITFGHPATLEILQSINGATDVLAAAPLPRNFSTPLTTETLLEDSTAGPVYIRVTGNASLGSFSLSTSAEELPGLPPTGWLTK